MCEMLGMSARHPTDVEASFADFRLRGGETSYHDDGWGLAVYEEAAAKIVKEPTPAAESQCAACLGDARCSEGTGVYETPVAVGHIRLANPSYLANKLANTHPFRREFGGRHWVFAHNGKVPEVWEADRFELGRFRPVGETDSEYVFCHFLARIAEVATSQPVSPEVLAEALESPAEQMSAIDEFNFLLTDGRHLVAYANEDLHRLDRECREHGCDQRVTMLATTPLTGENWERVTQDELQVFREGRRVV